MAEAVRFALVEQLLQIVTECLRLAYMILFDLYKTVLECLGFSLFTLSPRIPANLPDSRPLYERSATIIHPI